MRRNTPLASMVVFLAALILLGSSCRLWSDRHSSRPDIRVMATWWEPSAMKYGMRQASGRIRNNTDAAFDTVRVLVDLYGAQGDRLYSKEATVLRLPPHGDAVFTTLALPGSPTRYQVRRIDGVGRSRPPRSLRAER